LALILGLAVLLPGPLRGSRPEPLLDAIDKGPVIVLVKTVRTAADEVDVEVTKVYAVPRLIALTRDPEANIAKRAGMALAHYPGNADATQALIALTRHPDPQVRSQSMMRPHKTIALRSSRHCWRGCRTRTRRSGGRGNIRGHTLAVSKNGSERPGVCSCTWRRPIADAGRRCPSWQDAGGDVRRSEHAAVACAESLGVAGRCGPATLGEPGSDEAAFAHS
jgi:hypothetical protein